MKIQIDIDTSNAAFDGPSCNEELHHVIAKALKHVPELPQYGHKAEVLEVERALYDYNGNRVGTVRASLA